jgi:hypothetical protein
LQLRAAVDAYRAAKPPQATAEPLKSPKPVKRRSLPLERPTEIPGYPLNDSPPQDIPDYGNIARVTAMQEQRRERQRKIGALRSVKPIGVPQLIKRTAG